MPSMDALPSNQKSIQYMHIAIWTGYVHLPWLPSYYQLDPKWPPNSVQLSPETPHEWAGRVSVTLPGHRCCWIVFLQISLRLVRPTAFPPKTDLLSHPSFIHFVASAKTDRNSAIILTSISTIAGTSSISDRVYVVRHMRKLLIRSSTLMRAS